MCIHLCSLVGRSLLTAMKMPPFPTRQKNDLILKIGLIICKLAKGSFVSTANAITMQSDLLCCPSGQYKSDVQSSCKDCPADSHPVLAGYYCEKDW